MQKRNCVLFTLLTALPLRMSRVLHTLQMAHGKKSVVFVAERGCRAAAVENAASEFRRFASSRFLSVEVKTMANAMEARKDFPGCFVVRTMEAQERHGRHTLLAPDNSDELYVELASYRYDSAPTSHFIKFEMGSVSYEHPLTQEFFNELVRRLPLHEKLPAQRGELPLPLHPSQSNSTSWCDKWCPCFNEPAQRQRY
ncbi:Hypothetical protein, putative [Bodo saltans]|uniref:Uncharacterized protein n=1 Tax=Bodo saltans TaxID=75058 RepID=A0A0S4JBA9_BODSA|nr:Hypothetical protein, putative [Bodo saltans]|eukprot:CUG87227.1 Hypothetical protein, putative [Bodo saltans]